MINVLNIEIDYSKRMIVISDIHANVTLFKELLDKVNYTEEDYLFVNGDLCEKGPNSLEVVAYVRELSNQSDKVFVTKGNCDVVFRYVFDGVEGIISYMKKQRHSVLNEMIQEHGKTIDDFANVQELVTLYREHFQNEIDWLESLPHAYETENHIIIHAGISNIVNWRDTEESFALSAPAFYEKEHQADQTVIVGHWPVVNYRAQQISSNNPVINLDKRIIALDGGNQIKRDGQLNALIIENENYSYTYVDELTDKAIIQKDHVDTTGRVGTVTYPNYELKLVLEEEYFTLCENRNLGIQQWIKNEFISVEDDTISSKGDLSTTFLSVTKGEEVSVVNNACAGYALIKRMNGEVGWIPKTIMG
ncbi:metallophosphoesterase [Ornithinibacillus salinisoli]|uniref:Metallophosphoesterase n=1 Tax=Ornithinibacillus salinisoli TaxID=1848459 RepID=A0ABW4VWK8_9BACI